MLKSAQLYKEQLEKIQYKAWYNESYKYYNGSAGFNEIKLWDNNCDCHQFVSVDKDDNVIGYICYAVDWTAMSVCNFGIISYKKGNIEFAKDLYKAICNIFEVYHMNRIEWSAYADNPAIRGYRNFIKKHGGRECGYCRQVAKLQDGKLHDSVQFEILAEEFVK